MISSSPDYLLDSTVYRLPLLASPERAPLERWQEIGFSRTAVSVLTEADILSGLYAQGEERSFHYYQHTVRDHVRVLEVDRETARLYARLRSRYPGKDQDLILAATAKVHGMVIATLGQTHPFTHLPVQWEDWRIPTGKRDGNTALDRSSLPTA